MSWTALSFRDTVNDLYGMAFGRDSFNLRWPLDRRLRSASEGDSISGAAIKEVKHWARELYMLVAHLSSKVIGFGCKKRAFSKVVKSYVR